MFLIGCNESAFKHVPPKCMNRLFTLGVFLSCHQNSVTVKLNCKSETSSTHRARTVCLVWQAQWSRRQIWRRSTWRSPVQMLWQLQRSIRWKGRWRRQVCGLSCKYKRKTRDGPSICQPTNASSTTQLWQASNCYVFRHRRANLSKSSRTGPGWR